MSFSSDLPILILTHEFYPKRGGIATFTEEIARAATETGRKVEVWAPKYDVLSDNAFPFKIRRLNLKGSQNVSCQLQLAREWIKNRDSIRNSIVYLSDPGPILAMRYLQFLHFCKPARLVLTFHGSEILKFSSNPYCRMLVNQVLKNTDRISVLSEFSRALLETKFPLSNTKTTLTRGALKSGFQANPPKKSRSGRPLRILTVGRLHPRKGQAKTLEALADLPESLREDIEYWVVGSGKKFGYRKALEDVAKKVGFRVTFFGDVSDEKLQTLYSKADIFSLTSVNFQKSVEGYGLVYLEAAAYGLPIVANRVGGVSEAVSHEKNGILVKPNDKRALTTAFARLIQDKELRRKMGLNGLDWSRRNSWIESANKLFNDLGTHP